MIITTQFNIGDTVTVKQISRAGRILGMYYGRLGIEYEVRYFDNAKPETVYFLDEELQKVPE